MELIWRVYQNQWGRCVIIIGENAVRSSFFFIFSFALRRGRGRKCDFGEIARTLIMESSSMAANEVAISHLFYFGPAVAVNDHVFSLACLAGCNLCNPSLIGQTQSNILRE